MQDRFARLTERERATLRLLVAGHDAKSIAREQGLSVHTVNERLRDARAKLGVTSSRTAARLLAEAERGPEIVGDRLFGVAGEGASPPQASPSDRARHVASRLTWLAGGMLIMSLIIAAIALASAFRSAPRAEAPVAVAPPPAEADPAGAAAARAWLALVDDGRWEESWRTAAASFRAQIDAARWAAMVAPVRAPLGPAESRRVESTTATGALPGMPAGRYEVLQLRTDFAQRRGVVETVTLAREPDGWRVIGYFIH